MQDIESSTAAMNSLQGTVLASSDNDGLHIEYPQYNACFYCNNSVSYLYIYVNTHNLSHGARQFSFLVPDFSGFADLALRASSYCSLSGFQRPSSLFCVCHDSCETVTSCSVLTSNRDLIACS
jgi:hypothetical protein